MVLVLGHGMFWCQAQKATDKVDPNNVNFELVEQLFLEKLNQYRLSLSMPQLSTSYALKLAATDQALYQQRTNQLSHFQETAAKHSVLDRVLYYKSLCHMAGENCLFTWIGTPIRDTKTRRIKILESYQEVADGLFEQWKNSPGHHKVMTTSPFKSTGMGFAYDPGHRKLYAVQVFTSPFEKN